jgi:hypothetical protein
MDAQPGPIKAQKMPKARIVGRAIMLFKPKIDATYGSTEE